MKLSHASTERGKKKEQDVKMVVITIVGKWVFVLQVLSHFSVLSVFLVTLGCFSDDIEWILHICTCNSLLVMEKLISITL